MTTYVTAERAVDLAVKVAENHHMMCDTNSLRKRVYSWYNNTDVTNPEVLAACALTGVSYYRGATHMDMINMRNNWFLY